jgi:hypothetical protein
MVRRSECREISDRDHHRRRPFGLAMSWHLTARSIDHVVLERGEVANSWRTERWTHFAC